MMREGFCEAEYAFLLSDLQNKLYLNQSNRIDWLLTSARVAEIEGRALLIAHSVVCWQAHRVSDNPFSSSTRLVGSSSCCFSINRTTDPAKKVVKHLYYLKTVCDWFHIMHTVN
ncbi:unnamed protein product [Arctogadus glacialis]